MTRTIIFILYHRCKITISKFYSIFTEYLYFFIFLILTIYSSQMINLHASTLKNSKLAFNINIIYLSQPIDKYKTVKRIQLEGFNSIFLKKFLFNIEHVNPVYIVKKIEYLKNYGFLAKLKLSYISLYDIKYITLNFKINPILKRIKISKQKALIIPRNFLINTFYRQIGLPKNYVNIHNSIQNINLWYKSRGFDWVNVELVNKKQSEEINLEIFEGKIATTSIICQEAHISCNKIMYDIENEIKQKLGLIPGYILNVRKVELGIIELKKNQLIDSYTYSISKHSSGLHVLFKYNLFKSSKVFFFEQETIFFYYKQMIGIYKRYLDKIKLDAKFYKKCRHIYNNKIVLNIKSIIAQLNEKVNCSILPLFKHIGFKYYSYPRNQYSYGFILDIKIIGRNTNIDILFLYPYIKLGNFALGYTTLNIYYQYSLLYHLEKLQLLNLYNINRKSIYTKLYSFGFNIQLINNINKYIYFNQKLINHFNISTHKIINIYSYYPYNLYIKKTKNIYLLPINLQTATKIIQQSLMILKIKIKYNTLLFAQRLKSGTLFIVESIYSIPLFVKKTYLGYQIQYYNNQKLHIKYNQVHILPKIKKFEYSNILIFLAELELYIHQQSYRPIINTTYANTILKKGNINYYGSQSLFIYLIEYNLSLYDYLSFYIFFNFAYNLNFCHSISLLNFNKYYIFNNSVYYDINIGSGIQFNTPIKRIPTLRIEYRINNKKNNFLQLCVYSKYSN
uniref:POTRA domain-containing protein n=1 Tax=Mastocarpus papillatus TaxID=31436 RepID=A0A342RZN3_9FLOR|nr:hypothetical protein 621 [Mastocarpus papillatus]AOL58179.1 hypothetical protein 621 [Mastocarpus papillatus]